MFKGKDKTIPKEFALHQNYPNPFNPITNIEFDIAERTRVRIEVYDVLGRVVKWSLLLCYEGRWVCGCEKDDVGEVVYFPPLFLILKMLFLCFLYPLYLLGGYEPFFFSNMLCKFYSGCLFRKK